MTLSIINYRVLSWSTTKYTILLFVHSSIVLTPLQKKYLVDFDDELKIGDVRYDNMT